MSERLQLIQVISDEYESQVRQLFHEYVQLLHDRAYQEYEISIDINEILNMFMEGVEAFHPPQGRIYLAEYEGEIVGVGCLKQLDVDICEIKRMFVLPEYRRKGIGKTILGQLISDARSLGYTRIRLDSPKIFSASHQLYQSSNFQYIDPYLGSEGAESQPDLFLYMEMVL